MAISEKMYWVALSIVFIVVTISFGVSLLYIPPNSLGYDLAIGIFTSSVFMVLTIVFFSWLLSVREKSEWRIVENEVLFDVKMEFSALLDIIFRMLKDGENIRKRFWDNRKDFEGNRTGLIKLLTKLKDENPLNISDEAVEKLLLSKGLYGPLIRVNNKLKDTQQRYAKHLSSALTLGILHISRDVFMIENQCKAIEIAGKYQSVTIPNLDLSEIKKMSEEDELFTMLTNVGMSSILTSYIIRDIIKEILSLQTSQFKFYYPTALSSSEMEKLRGNK